jgi:hypothetical protein
MAFQTGSQINPALGAINYTPYMQGAVAGAQAIGQGIANLGQGIASGIEQYQKQKKENKMMEAQLKANINSLEGLGAISSSLSPQAQEVFNGTMSKLNDPSTPLVEKLALSQSAQKTVGELLNFGIQEREKQQQMIATNAAYTAAQQGGELPLVLSPEVRAQAIPQMLAMQEQQAKIEAAKAPKLANLSFNKQAFNAERTAREQKLGKPLNAEQTAQLFSDIQGRSQPQVPGPAEMANVELMKKRNERMLEDEDLQIKSAISLEPAATQLLNALDSGKVDTGFFGNAISYVKRAGEAVGLSDLGATETELGQKGLAALNAASLSGLARGLGSMSNADREFFVSGMPSFNNREQTIRFYAEMAKANAAFAKEDKAFIRNQEKAGVPYQDILSDLENRRDQRQVGQDIYNRIIGPSSVKPVAGQTTKVKL